MLLFEVILMCWILWLNYLLNVELSLEIVSWSSGHMKLPQQIALTK